MTTFDEKILSVVNKLADKIGSSSGSSSGSDSSGSTDTTDDSKATITINNPFKDKWVSILGDSISTYQGYNPDGQEYTEQADLTDVKKTWWGYLLDKLGAKLCVNNSENGIACCGGAGAVNLGRDKLLHRVAGITYPNLDGSTTQATTTINPDIILVFLGHNDYNAQNRAFGTYDLITPRATDYKDISSVCAGFETLMNDLTYAYPDATVYIMNPIYVGGEDKTTWPKTGNAITDPTTDGYWSQPRLADMIRTLTLKYGMHYIETNRLGILPTTDHSGTDKFLYGGYSHPTAAGHKIIAHKVLSSMLYDYAGWAVRNDI